MPFRQDSTSGDVEPRVRVHSTWPTHHGFEGVRDAEFREVGEREGLRGKWGSLGERGSRIQGAKLFGSKFSFPATPEQTPTPFVVLCRPNLQRGSYEIRTSLA